LQDILITGAKEHSLPQSYQAKLCAVKTLEAPQSTRYRFGKWLFDGLWLRVAQQIERNVRKYQGKQGNVPPWFLKIFDILLWTMWIQHDYFHGIVFGWGDGR
jgi:hypothetical protein